MDKLDKIGFLGSGIPFRHSLPSQVGCCMDTGTLIEIFLWTVVAVLGGFIYFRIKKIGPLKPTVMEIPPQPKPEVVLRDFTPAELKEHTGASPDKPVLLAVKVR